jgi:CBS domain-containing protein
VNVNANIGEVAAILLNNHISAAPVVDEKGELVGIVSEGDFMRRPEIGTTKPHSWWLELISSEWKSATEYIKSHSRKVADVMTRDVITAKPDTPLGDVAELLERNRIKRVPIGGANLSASSAAQIFCRHWRAQRKNFPPLPRRTIPNCAKRSYLGWLQSHGGRPC